MALKHEIEVVIHGIEAQKIENCVDRMGYLLGQSWQSFE